MACIIPGLELYWLWRSVITGLSYLFCLSYHQRQQTISIWEGL